MASSEQPQQQAAVGHPAATFWVQGPPNSQPGGFVGSAQDGGQQEGYQMPSQPTYPGLPVYCQGAETDKVAVEPSCCSLQLKLWGVGWILFPCWIVGAFLPLCVRRKPSDRPGWVLNIIFSLLVVALATAIAVLVTHGTFLYGSPPTPTCIRVFQSPTYNYNGPCDKFRDPPLNTTESSGVNTTTVYKDRNATIIVQPGGRVFSGNTTFSNYTITTTTSG